MILSNDCQHATWPMIDSVTGFALPAWQGGIGSVVVRRQDGKGAGYQNLVCVTDDVR